MKFLVFSLFAFAINSAMAASGDIFSVLNVAPVNASKAPGAEILMKQIGGLSCAKFTVVAPQAESQYMCTLDTENFNAELVYNALNVDENDVSQDPASVELEKIAETLICTKSTPRIPNAQSKYSCSVGF